MAAPTPNTVLLEVPAKKIAIYPASFDPLTKAHLSVATRAASDFEKLFVAAAVNPGKKYEFSLAEKLDFLQASLGHIANAEVIVLSDGLTVDHARRLGARVMIRGFRGVPDFMDEQELVGQNRFVQEAIGITSDHPEYVETMPYYAEPTLGHVSSSLVRGLMKLPGVEYREERIRPLVPEPVFETILTHL
jgi:pantetheine-phosphate adenylyltransferase